LGRRNDMYLAAGLYMGADILVDLGAKVLIP
jgi:hypothetical protein